jgi:hypothetical protein
MGASRPLPGTRAFAQPDRPLTTIHRMLGEVHPVDHQHRQLESAKLPPHQLRKLVPGPGHEPLATAFLLVPPTPTLSPSSSSDRA